MSIIKKFFGSIVKEVALCLQTSFVKARMRSGSCGAHRSAILKREETVWDLRK